MTQARAFAVTTIFVSVRFPVRIIAKVDLARPVAAAIAL